MASRFFAGLFSTVLLFQVGCPSAKNVDPSIHKSAEQPSTTAFDAKLSAPSLQYLAVDGTASAVVVAGYPLLFTRQILPLGGDGKLVGEDSAASQIEQVLANLENVLVESGSEMGRLVKVNAFAESLETIDQFRKQLASRLDASVRPAVCAVISPLPLSGARIAVDVVAAADSQDEAVVLRQSEAVVSHAQCADVAVMPKGGVVYLSGQPDKSPLAEATVKSMSTLLDVIHQLELQPAQIVQLKVFIDSASAAGTVISELKKLLPGQMLPPVTFVEWIASAPIEIEVVMHLPTDSWHGGETLRFYTPTGVQPSPTFSKVAVLETDRQIYVSGLSAAAAGGAESQVQDVFRQLQQVLSASGSDLTHLAKATYYVSDKDASDALNKLRPEYYDPERPPAASKAMVHGVDQAGRTVTIDMIAVAGDDQDLSGSQENSP